MQVIGPHCTSRILEGLVVCRGLVEPRKGIGCQARQEEPNKTID